MSTTPAPGDRLNGDQTIRERRSHNVIRNSSKLMVFDKRSRHEKPRAYWRRGFERIKPSDF